MRTGPWTGACSIGGLIRSEKLVQGLQGLSKLPKRPQTRHHVPSGEKHHFHLLLPCSKCLGEVIVKGHRKSMIEMKEACILACKMIGVFIDEEFIVC